MLNIFGSNYRVCDGVSRRDFLTIGALGLGGLSLADVLRLRASSAEPGRASNKSVIMVYLPGGPSHIDMYDLKPNAPEEFRGEFRPIRTNVPGFDICELMPLQSRIADKMTVIRGLQSVDTHSAELLMRGTMSTPRRPVFGSVVSRMTAGSTRDGMPHYVALGGENGSDPADPTYLGTAHRPFTHSGAGMQNLQLSSEVTLNRLNDRQALLRSFDNVRREIDVAGNSAGLDAFTSRAFEMIASPRTRQAFDIGREPQSIRERYGPAGRLLLALRLVQAGVSVVTVSLAGTVVPGGDWDTHAGGDQRSETNFDNLRRKLPVYDQAIHALITDLYDRGLDQDVTVVVWGEFGRTPRINRTGGRDHWAPAGFVVVAGGGYRMGQVIGDTGPRAERVTSTIPYTPANLLATLYTNLGIDPGHTLPDFNGRPMYILDDRRMIAEL